MISCILHMNAQHLAGFLQASSVICEVDASVSRLGALLRQPQGDHATAYGAPKKLVFTSPFG